MDHDGDTHSHGHCDSQSGDGDSVAMQRAPEVLGSKANHPTRAMNDTDEELHHGRHKKRKTRGEKSNGSKAQEFSSAVECPPREPDREDEAEDAVGPPVAGFMGEGIALRAGSKHQSGVAARCFGSGAEGRDK